MTRAVTWEVEDLGFRTPPLTYANVLFCHANIVKRSTGLSVTT